MIFWGFGGGRRGTGIIGCEGAGDLIDGDGVVGDRRGDILNGFRG